MPLTSRLYRRIDKLDPGLKDVLLDLVEEMDNSVKKEDFNELKSVVADLAQAQKRTEERLDSLTAKIEELAEAQKRTEARVEELAEAQKRTEERLDSLTARVEELAEAQKRTEESLNKLIKRVDNIEVQLGGLAMAVGYGIEDKLYPHLKNFVARVYGANVQRVVLRENVMYPNGKFDEVNLYAEATIDQRDVLVVGECKAQPGKKDIDKFVNMVWRLKEKFNKEIYPFVVGYAFSLDVESYLSARYPEVKYFKTYQIEHGEI